MIEAANVTPIHLIHILMGKNDRMFFVRYTYNEPKSKSVDTSNSCYHGKSGNKMD